VFREGKIPGAGQPGEVKKRSSRRKTRGWKISRMK
jgi:hypothetical protein